jgi:hypothetical protein
MQAQASTLSFSENKRFKASNVMVCYFLPG